MISVTYLAPTGKTYAVGIGAQVYRFLGGTTVDGVPEAVANHLRPLKDRLGRPLFRITQGDQNAEINEMLGVQLEFASWPSSLQ